MEFIAIEVLEGKPHTYRHDLESFFYVFLWVTVQGRDKTLLKTSQLRDWHRGEGGALCRSPIIRELISLSTREG